MVCLKVLFGQFLRNGNWEILNYEVHERIPTVGAAVDNFFLQLSLSQMSVE
jgi:hypothetical protein